MKNKTFLEKQMPNNDKSYFRYTINEEIKEIIKECINNKFLFLLKKLEKYFGNPIFLSDCQIKRNYSMPELFDTNNKKDNEPYNNFFHCDGYIYNYFKIFINLHDVDKDTGPLNFFSQKDNNYFIKKTNYKNRLDYDKVNLSGRLKKNVGKIGDRYV